MRVVVALVLAAAGVVVALAESAAPLSASIVGGQFDYTVKPGDSLTRVGARFGDAPRRIAERSGLDAEALLHPGQRLRIDSRHIVPAGLASGILINIPQRMLFLVQDGKPQAAYPVGVGRPSWPTPVGRFEVTQKATNKPWVVPPSIQEELRCEQDMVRTLVPPGPDNPLGAHWLALSIPGYGIHGTIAPASVYHFQSHGCIRMHPDDIADLYARIAVGTPGRLIYEPVLIARLSDGRIYLEAHADVYQRGLDLRAAVEHQLDAAGLTEQVDWPAIGQALAQASGAVVRIDRGGPESPG